jgi:hypothetical protein
MQSMQLLQQSSSPSHYLKACDFFVAPAQQASQLLFRHVHQSRRQQLLHLKPDPAEQLHSARAASKYNLA